MNRNGFDLTMITDELSRNTKYIFGDKLRKIILYGSYARGDYNEGSDLDIMVLADFNDSEKLLLQAEVDKIAGSASLDYDITISMILRDINFFDAHVPVLPYYKNVVNEGVELYVAG